MEPSVQVGRFYLLGIFCILMQIIIRTKTKHIYDAIMRIIYYSCFPIFSLICRNAYI